MLQYKFFENEIKQIFMETDEIKQKINPILLSVLFKCSRKISSDAKEIIFERLVCRLGGHSLGTVLISISGDL